MLLGRLVHICDEDQGTLKVYMLARAAGEGSGESPISSRLRLLDPVNEAGGVFPLTFLFDNVGDRLIQGASL